MSVQGCIYLILFCVIELHIESLSALESLNIIPPSFLYVRENITIFIWQKGALVRIFSPTKQVNGMSLKSVLI